MPYNPNSMKNLKPWKPGMVPKGGGRPAGHGKKSLMDCVREYLETIDPKDKEHRTQKQLLAISLVENAKKGNSTAMQQLADRLDGKVKQQVDMTTTGSQTITLEIKFGSSKQMFTDFDSDQASFKKDEDWKQ